MMYLVHWTKFQRFCSFAYSAANVMMMNIVIVSIIIIITISALIFNQTSTFQYFWRDLSTCLETDSTRPTVNPTWPDP